MRLCGRQIAEPEIRQSDSRIEVRRDLRLPCEFRFNRLGGHSENIDDTRIACYRARVGRREHLLEEAADLLRLARLAAGEITLACRDLRLPRCGDEPADQRRGDTDARGDPGFVPHDELRSSISQRVLTGDDRHPVQMTANVAGKLLDRRVPAGWVHPPPPHNNIFETTPP